jgi:hypothetical protein
LNVSSRRGIARVLPGLCALLLSACPAPYDPNEPLPTVEVGTGDHRGFLALTEVPGVVAENGPQGGSHISVWLRTDGFEGPVTIDYGVKDGPTGQSISQSGLRRHLESVPPDGILPLAAFLLPGDTRNLVGRPVTLWANVKDRRHPAIHDERATQVVDPSTWGNPP